MDRLLTALPLLVVATAASAQNLPELDFTCPSDIRVQAKAGGPVTINDKQATLHKFSEQYFEAKGEGVTISVSLDGKGTPTVSYTGKKGANGICEVTKEAEDAPATEAAAQE
ncbi:hypothetical protein A9179_00390 [Pseudomonas alcaligenes]|uniref:C-type lysozyme inhibitor domain-containing protein n=1 Tax=Aquipseudomonas alcaligenes TaxID=43263 RepID=A0ABR7RVK4_AQUAC|nr:hypothetical protein [Pseudomonas alcaligenes]MBC9248722.1 hypothetical protein [Pseudomonas alcaligenes]